MATEVFAPAETEEYVPASPFAETFQLSEVEAGPLEAPATTVGFESPFRSEYLGEAYERGESPEREAYGTMVASLYEMEFSEALYELGAEAAAYAQQFGENEATSAGELQEYVERYMAPLGSEAENLFERLAERYAQHDIAGMSETEVDRLFETIQPSYGHLSPAFEGFLSGLWNKAKSIAKGAINVVKSGIATIGKFLPLGWIFNRLKPLIKPLLQRVLQFALDRLPTPLRPIASKLAARLFGRIGLGEAEVEAQAEATSETGEALANADPDSIQREFDARVASLFFARDEADREVMSGEATMETQESGEDRVAALDAARETFATEITHLQRGQDPTAQLENFLPAVMAALRIGINVIGRQRVVGFLSNYLGQVIKPYVGAEMATPLSNAIVSTGMSLVGLEVPTDRQQLAGEAIANAVEGTVRRLGEQGSHIFEDQRLLEAATQEAFNEAAAESFPPQMIRENLLEVSPRSGVLGTWVLRPVQGRKHYKAYTRPIDVHVTSQIANTVKSFGGIPLDEFLRSRFGVNPPIKAKAYLYEAIYGTTVSAIARNESRVPILGPAARKPWRYFLPLTSQTAGLLFGEPNLGRDVPSQFLMSPRRVMIGERFVVLVPEGAKPPVTKPTTGRASQVNVTLDFPGSQVRAFIYLSERDTQAVAASIRKGESATPALMLVRDVYIATLRSMLSGNASRHVKVIHEAAAQEQWVGAALGAVGEALLKKVADKVLEWVGLAISEYFTRKRQEFEAAANKRADGVTMLVTVTHNSMMQVLEQAISGNAFRAGLALTKALLLPAQVNITTVAGFRS
jgi:hypothetical protein